MMLQEFSDGNSGALLIPIWFANHINLSIPRELVRNADSEAPLWTYEMKTHTLIQFTGDSHIKI